MSNRARIPSHIDLNGSICVDRQWPRFDQRQNKTSNPGILAYTGNPFNPASWSGRASAASCSRGCFNQHAVTMTTLSLPPLPVAYGKVVSQSCKRRVSSDPVQHSSLTMLLRNGTRNEQRPEGPFRTETVCAVVGTYNTTVSLNCDGGPCLTRHAGFGRLRVQGSSEVLR